MSNPANFSDYYSVCQGLASATGTDFYTKTIEESANRFYAFGQRSYESSTDWQPSGALDWSSGVVSDPAATSLKKKLVAVANDEVWYESTSGTMVELAAAHGDIDTSANLVMFEAYQKVFIINEGTYRVVDFGNVKLSTAAIGANLPNHGTSLTVAATGSQILVDFIDSNTGACLIYGRRLTADTFASGETVTGTNTAGNAVSFVLDADEVLPDPPHWYPYTTYANFTVTADMVYGELPDSATLGCLYRGRVTLSGDTNNPNQWYMARQANPWDWVYSAADAQAPVAGNDADAGEIGDIITALVPYKDDYLLFSCSDSLWRLNGDAAAGGVIVEVDLAVGIMDKYAWCFDGEDNFYFLSPLGLYVMAGNSDAGVARPMNLTKIKLPEFPQDWDINTSIHRVTLAYDRKRHGIVICKTLLSDGSNENMWYDLRTDGLFPETYPDNGGVYSAVYYSAIDPDYQDLLMGGTDGYIRKFDTSKKNDDDGASDAAISSYIVIGPDFIGKDADSYSKLTSISFVIAKSTDGLNYQIFMEDTSEEILTKLDAATKVPRISGSLTVQNRPVKIRQRAKGIFMALRLYNSTASQTWGLETIVGQVEPAGGI